MRSSHDRPGTTVTQLAEAFAARRPMFAARLALRTRSSTAREALARSLPGGARGELELMDLALGERLPADLLHGRSGRVIAALALVWAGLGWDGSGFEASALTYRALWADGPRDDLPPPHHHLAAQTLLMTGRKDELRRLLPRLTRLPNGVRPFLETDLANPYACRAGSPAGAAEGLDVDSGERRHRAWEARLSDPFTGRGLAPLSVDPSYGDTGLPLFDRLSVRGVVPRQVDGPPVTVIVPCFRPDHGLLTSVASLAGQTYGPLQILLVDDASGPDHEEWFERALALDDRARLVRRTRNGGSYLSRNDALRRTTGRLVTFQDADDWSHPERIAAQVTWLDQHPAAPACRTQAVRMHDDLTHQWIGYPPVRAHASSLMVRSPVVERLGPFLPVRKGADSEYTERLVVEAGPVGLTRAPLAAYRLRDGSLSRADFSYQWAAPERLTFKGTYRAWQRAGRVPAFPAPVPFVQDLDQDRSSEHLDTAYLADFSPEPGPGVRPVAGVWARPAGDADRVGLWHLERPWAPDAERAEMHDRWFDRIVAEPTWQALARTEPVHVDRLVVLDPSVLLLAGDQECAVTAGSVVVRAGAEDDPEVDRDAVADVVRRWFGLDPVWDEAV